MQGLNNALKIVKNKSGASMMFVIAVMMLLMLAVASTLVAASASIGTDINKQTKYQLDMYADSIQKSIMYSLQTSDDDKGQTINGLAGYAPITLGGQILGAIYNEALVSYPDPVDIIVFTSGVSLNLTPRLSGAYSDLLSGASVMLRIEPVVVITPGVPKTDEVPPDLDADDEPILGTGSPAVPREPQQAIINGQATVTVKANHMGKSITSVVTYNFFDGFLEDDGNDFANMLIENAGEWEFVSHEKASR